MRLFTGPVPSLAAKESIPREPAIENSSLDAFVSGTPVAGRSGRRRRVQRPGKGNLFSYCERLLVRRIGDYKELMDLAQRR